MCTLNMNKVTIASARADDNGAYSRRGNTSKYYFLSNESCQLAHKTPHNTFFVNIRDTSSATNRPVYEKRFVGANCVYQLQRQYRYSKSNKFYNMIAVIKRADANEPYQHYLYLSRWMNQDKDEEDTEFVVERHGNAKKNHAAAYYRKDASVLHEVQQKLNNGTTPDEVYIQMNKNIEHASSISEIISNPKLVYNQKQKMRKATNKTIPTDTEAEVLINLVQDDSFVQSVRFDDDCYSSVNYLPYMLNDLKRFCVNGNSPWIVDTTFKVADHIWYTDSSYENESLVDANDKHPQFPGPSQWQFRRNQQSFRRFIGELLIADPQLQQIRKVGHDLDSATSNGLIDLLPYASHLWCTQHLQTADAEKLKKMGANRKSIYRIMADIYGTQINTMMSQGLADAEDLQDLNVKLETLKEIWEDLVPGFHSWFKKRRLAKFESCLILSARDELGITGRFYSNGLELKHRLLKKKLSDLSSPSDIASSSRSLTKWAQENYLDEARKAIIGQGKYRLAAGYQMFFTTPVAWIRWSQERRSQHFEAFLNYNPKSFNRYVKPVDAGAKRKPGEKRRATLPEPDLFSDRISQQPPTPSNDTVTPLKLTKKTDCAWQVKRNAIQGSEVDIFDPNRTSTKLYSLVHKKCKSSFPASVKRCEECKISFTTTDIIAVKTAAVREYTDQHGNRKKHTGNVYLHYLKTCLKAHDQKFEFSTVVVPKKTREHLTNGQIAKLMETGCLFE